MLATLASSSSVYLLPLVIRLFAVILLLCSLVIPVIFKTSPDTAGLLSASIVIIQHYLLCHGSDCDLELLISCLLLCLSIHLIGPLIFSFSQIPSSQFH